MLVGDKSNTFLDKRLVETLNTSFKVHSSLSHDDGPKGRSKSKNTLRANILFRNDTPNRYMVRFDTSKSDAIVKAMKKAVRTDIILQTIESFLGEKWVYTNVLKFSTLNMSISKSLSSSIDWSSSFSISGDGHEKTRLSTVSKLFSTSFQKVDIESSRLECRAIEKDIASLEVMKDALEQDCRRLNSFINAEALSPLVNTDMKMLCYLSYKLNCARHGNFHTMKKSAKTDYLRMLKDNWEANKKGVNETYLFMTRSVDTLLKAKESFRQEAISGIRSALETPTGNDSCEHAASITSVSAASSSTQEDIKINPTVIGATNLQKEDETANKDKASSSSSGRGGSKPIRPRGKLLTFSESTAESSRPNGLEDDEAIIRSRVARSSEILQSFNDEVKEKMNAVMSMALEAAGSKYGKSSSRADGQQDGHTAILTTVQSRIEHLEYLTASFIRQQEKLRDGLLNRQREDLHKMSLLALERRKNFLARLKENFANTEQLVVMKRREKRNNTTSQPPFQSAHLGRSS